MFSEEVKSTADLSTTPKAILDSKRRNDLVDEAFSEQKDILLDMVRIQLFFIIVKSAKAVYSFEDSNIFTKIYLNKDFLIMFIQIFQLKLK